MYQKKKIALYTVITGNYESHIRYSYPLKLMPCLDAAFIVTDSIDMKNEAEQKGWNSILIDKPDNSKKCQRQLKILQNFHEDLKILNEYDVIIYHDGNNVLRNNTLLMKSLSLINKYDVICYSHPIRKTSKSELDVVLSSGMISKSAWENVNQIYKLSNYPDNLGLSDTRVLIRKTCDKLKEFCEEWINNMNATNSYRDQTIFEYALWKHNVSFKRMKNKEFPFVCKGGHSDPNNMRYNID